MSPEGSQEYPGIKNDIQKLHVAVADHALMLIISANPLNKTFYYIRDLSEDIGLTVYDYYIFTTIDPAGKDVELWVAGFQVK